MAGSMLDSEKVEEEVMGIAECQDTPQKLSEDNESQKDELSKNTNSNAPATHPEGWMKITKRRQSGKTAGKFDVVFVSPQGTKLRSKTALLKYLHTHHASINLQDFDFSVPSQLQSPATTRVRKCHYKYNGDSSTTLSGVPEEHTTQPVDRAEDTHNTEEDVFIVKENDRNTTRRSVGRKRVRSHRKGSERALKDVARMKRIRKYSSSSSKSEMQTKLRKYKRTNVVSKNPKKEASETDTESENWSQGSTQHPLTPDHNASNHPNDVSDPVLVTEDTDGQTSPPLLEKPPETENEKAGSKSSDDDDSVTSSGNSKDSISKSQVEKRKTSHYFSKKATRDVQMLKKCYDYRRQQHQEQRSGFRASRTEEQEPSHEATSERSQLYPVGPEGTNSATMVEAVQGAESVLVGPSTLHSSGPLVSCGPSTQEHCCGGEGRLVGALNTFMDHWQSKQSPMYHFAVSLVPLLEKVSQDRVVALRNDMLRLITSYLSSDTLPRQQYVYPLGYQFHNPQPYSPPPPNLVLTLSQPPARHSLPSTSYAEILQRYNTSLIPASSSEPSSYSPHEKLSSSLVKSKPTYCIII